MGESQLDAQKYSLLLDWCCMATQPEPSTGETQRSSLLVSPITPIFGSPALHKWAAMRLSMTLGPAPTHRPDTGQSNTTPQQNSTLSSNTPTQPQQLDVALIAQVTTAVMAAMRMGGGILATTFKEEAPRTMDNTKPYSAFQLAKLKGFCSVLEDCDIPPIWDYFHSTKDVDAHRTKLLEEMGKWAWEHDVTLTRGIYFNKSTMDEIVKLEFNPGAATAYFATAEKGVLILVVRPCRGNKTANIRLKENAMQLTEQNYTPTDALGQAQKSHAHHSAHTWNLYVTSARFVPSPGVCLGTDVITFRIYMISGPC
jgi:hypothetical protein